MSRDEPSGFALDRFPNHAMGKSGTGMLSVGGQQVAQPVKGEEEAGYHKVHFDASNLASGVSFYRLSAGTYVETRTVSWRCPGLFSGVYTCTMQAGGFSGTITLLPR